MKDVKNMLLAAMFTALTAIGAFIKIPLPFIPIVMQVFFVLLSGIILGKKWGMISQVVYLAIGLIGIPIFANGGGIGYVLQPTFGYLIGYVFASYAIGWYIEKAGSKSIKTIAIACLIGIVIIYLCGVPYFALVLKLVLGKTGAVKTALWSGLIVCIPGDIIKAICATLLGERIIRITKNIK